MEINDIGNGIGKVGSAIGRGLIAGMVGTAAITISQMIEMKITERESSDAPAKVGGKTLGVQPRNPEGKQRFMQVMHWGYGTSWGMFRGVLSLAGLKGPIATGMHFSAIWGTELVMIPNMTEAPPAKEWGAPALAKDALHHLVYAVAAGATYDYINRDYSEKSSGGWLDGLVDSISKSFWHGYNKGAKKLHLK